MGDDQVFVLDANVFIEAKNSYYAFDLAPLFWRSLIEHAETGCICSIDHVKNELERGNDQLAIWAKDEFVHAFASTDEENIIKYYSEIINWVNNNDQFLDIGKSDFAKGADGWLVAYAKENNCIVVTQEVQDDLPPFIGQVSMRVFASLSAHLS
jgi:uncharacterized protein DUF4411